MSEKSVLASASSKDFKLPNLSVKFSRQAELFEVLKLAQKGSDRAY